ncbi:MAG: nitroreductase family protein [Candidatus Bathyarchaeia archaeon]|nr:nitroreductase family protein [Candidatus Bathyarchaeia archaeon]
MEGPRLLNIILGRTSIRNFEKSKKVPEKNLKKILLAGIRAPSAGNIQPRTFVVVKDEAVKERLYQLCENQAFMKTAPVWIVICVDLHRHLKAAKLTGVEYDYTGILPYTFGVLDVALSLENMVIAAEALGLGSVIIGSVIEHPWKVKEIFKLPEHCLALSILCIGYPKKKPERREKWDSNVIVCEDRYRDVNARDVSEYWKKFISNDLKRYGKEVSDKKIEKLFREMSYGKLYSSHYKEEFVKTTSKKLMEFLKERGFLKD